MHLPDRLVCSGAGCYFARHPGGCHFQNDAQSPRLPSPPIDRRALPGRHGELLFLNRRWYRFSSVLLALLCSCGNPVFSGLSRYTIIYGKSFWTAVDSFLNGLTGQSGQTSHSLPARRRLPCAHLLAGLITGWMAAGLPRRIERWRSDTDNGSFCRQRLKTISILPGKTEADQNQPADHLDQSCWRYTSSPTWESALFFLQTGSRYPDPFGVDSAGLDFVIGPLLNQVLATGWKKKKSLREEIKQVLALCPKPGNWSLKPGSAAPSERRSALATVWQTGIV